MASNKLRVWHGRHFRSEDFETIDEVVAAVFKKQDISSALRYNLRSNEGLVLGQVQVRQGIKVPVDYGLAIKEWEPVLYFLLQPPLNIPYGTDTPYYTTSFVREFMRMDKETDEWATTGLPFFDLPSVPRLINELHTALERPGNRIRELTPPSYERSDAD